LRLQAAQLARVIFLGTILFQSEHHVMNQHKAHFDIAQTVTDLIIQKLEAGVKPWERPWTGAPVSRPLRSCGTPYRGINIFMLWMWLTPRAMYHPIG
jgi:antirestriction protein ArdC